MVNTCKKLLANVATAKIIDRTVMQLLPNWVTVFMLHRLQLPGTSIRGISPQYLTRCLQYLRSEGFDFISLEDAVAGTLDGTLAKKKWVAFSLDDGYFDQVDIAGDIFYQFDCPTTVFLITDFIDGALWPWDQQLVYVAAHARNPRVQIAIDSRTHALDLGHRYGYRDAIDLIRKYAPDHAYAVTQQIALAAQVELPLAPPEEHRPTSWDAVRSMEKKGMQFGAHSLSHRLTAGLNEIELEREITGSVARVRAECSRPANVFCYPLGKNGEFDERGIPHLKGLQMLGAFSAEPGFLTALEIGRDQNKRYAIPRMTIPEDFNQFKLSVSWAQYVRESLQPARKSSTAA